MEKRAIFVIAISTIFVIGAVYLLGEGITGKTISSTEEEMVKNTMLNYIQEKIKSNQGKYTIEGIDADFEGIHDSIKFKDGAFVACSDFHTEDAEFDVDLYVEKLNGKFEVVKEVLHKKDGEIVDQIIWEQ